MNNDKKVKFLNLGTMMKKKKKDPNDENEPQRFYIKLQQNKDKQGKPFGESLFPITLANGTVLNDGDILTMFSKKEKYKKLVEDGKMDQEKADQLSSFLLFDVCAVVPEKTADETDFGSEPNFDETDEIPF